MKHVQHLTENWKLKWFPFGHAEGQHLPDYDDTIWLDVKVPGEVHKELLKRDLIKDPNFSKNIEEREWVEKVDWWYRTRFYAPREWLGKRVELYLEGLDTFAIVWFNGEKIYESEDMFLPAIINISDKIRYGGENILAIRLGAPLYETIRRAKSFSEKNHLWNGTYARLYARKAQYQYGWDWAAKLLTVGIWRPVYITVFDQAVIRDVYVWTKSISEEKAVLGFKIEVFSLAPFEAAIDVLGKCEDSRFKKTIYTKIGAGANTVEFEVEVDKPRIWWPRGYGPQNLYNIMVMLLEKDKVVDVYELRTGIRTVELVTESSETPNGKVFYFKINGRKVFVRGANWIPAELLISRLTRDRYRELLELAVEGNHNMLRVWGGGLVEYDEFYQLCDELGIMLWHDFQFACGHYPEDEEFLELVEKEVTAIVKRLRNHPSIVLWCGNNENEMFDYHSGFYNKRHPIYFKLIPRLLKRLDPHRPYWPSSPWGGENPNSPHEGDRHNWDIYHGQAPIESFNEEEARFLSEFGMQAAPGEKTLQKFIPSGKLWPLSDDWLYHLHTPEKVIPYVAGMGRITSLDSYILLSQLAQALTLKTAIENCRRRKYACGGVLYWSLNTPWPNACWETIDYYANPKMGYYYAKKAYSPVLVSLLPVEDRVEVWLINDTQGELQGTLHIQVIDTAKGEPKTIIEDPVSIGSDSVEKVLDIPTKGLDPTKTIVYAEYRFSNEKTDNYALLTKHRYMVFAETKLTVLPLKVEELEEARQATISIHSTGYAHLVQIDTKEDIKARYSDNFLEIPPNTSKTVTITFPKTFTKVTLIIKAYNSEKIEKIITLAAT